MGNFEKIISLAYEASTEVDLWPEVLELLAREIGGEIGPSHLMASDWDGSHCFINETVRTDESLAEAYLSEFMSQDFRIPRFQAVAPKKLFYDHDMVSREEYLGSVLYNELFAKYEIHRLMGACMNNKAGFVWFGVSKRKKELEFSNEELATFQYVVPHVLRAMQIGRTNSDLSVSSAVYRNVLNRIKQCVVVLSNERIHEMNDAAERFLDETAFFKVIGNRLLAADREATDQLNHFLTRIQEPGVPDKIVLKDPVTDAQYLVTVHVPKFEMQDGRLRPGQFRVLTIVPLIAENSNKVDREALTQIEQSYKLAQAEAAVLQAVVSGVPLSDLAEEKGIQLDTVRKQLKSAMRKLNVRSQKDIIRILSAYTNSFG